MQATKNDLSANEAKLDYVALVKTAEIAVGHSLEQVSYYLNEIRKDRLGNYVTGLHCDANNMKNEAVMLEIACETLATLRGGETRENIVIVNKKEIQAEGK
jgi:hypothetical protein